VTFLDAYVHAQGVAGTERRDVAEPLFLCFDEGMHMTLGGGARVNRDWVETWNSNGSVGRSPWSMVCGPWTRQSPRLTSKIDGRQRTTGRSFSRSTAASPPPLSTARSSCDPPTAAHQARPTLYRRAAGCSWGR